jgi:hypothetical protein
LTLLLAAAGAILLIAPTAYHRALFRRGDKEYLVGVANRLTIAGLAAVGMAMVGAITFVADILYPGTAAFIIGGLAALLCVVLWAVLPLRRRRRPREERPLAPRRDPGVAAAGPRQSRISSGEHPRAGSHR